MERGANGYESRIVLLSDMETSVSSTNLKAARAVGCKERFESGVCMIKVLDIDKEAVA